MGATKTELVGPFFNLSGLLDDRFLYSPQDLVGGNFQAGEARDAEGFTGIDAHRLLVAAGGRRTVDFDDPFIQEDEPDLWDAGAGVKGQFDFPVVVGGGVGHFDQEDDVFRAGMGDGVKVRAVFEQGQVGLRLLFVSQLHRILDADDSPLPRSCREEAGKAVNAGGVPAANRTHFDQLPVNEFNPIVFAQDAGLGHPVVFRNRKGSFKLNGQVVSPSH